MGLHPIFQVLRQEGCDPCSPRVPHAPIIHLRPRHQFPAPKLCTGLVAASEANQCHQLAYPFVLAKGATTEAH